MKTRSVFIILLLVVPLMLFARNKQRPGNNIQDDIEIMETILDKLFDKHEGSFRLISGGTSGFYLDGYGILFKVPYSQSDRLYYVTPDKQARKMFDDWIISGQGQVISKRDQDADEKPAEFEKEMKEEITRVKDISARFLGDYVSALTYLEPSYWITVIVDFNDSPRAFSGFTPEKALRQVIGKVQKKNIADYHKGKIDFDKLKDRIQFVSKYENDSEMDGDIDIFSDIMNSYIEKGNEKNELHVIDAVKGFYLDGYGAIFIMKVNLQPNFINIITSGSRNNQFSVQAYSSFGDTIDFDEKLDILRDRITSLYARFGHTLRKLQPKEWLEVAVSLNTIHPDNDYSKVIYKIQKKDIDRLSSQKIGINEFKRLVNIARY
ncbi:hypothetical protein GF337_05980 [candidate division KSB1 bacterium]|nr:hypothetical protein [candidate division KSB1 bacterium]